MSVCDRDGVQLAPNDYQHVVDELVVIHYSGRTACTTTGEAAARLGLTEGEWRREFAAVVEAGHFALRPDGSYDAVGVDVE